MSMNHDQAGPPIRRRDLLIRGAGGLTLAGLGLKGTTVLAANLSNLRTPAVEVGPYWVEELLNRSDVRIDPATGLVQPGVPLRLNVTVLLLSKNGTTSPLRGAIVDIWQCNSLGIYSDEGSEGTSGEKFLRGLQVTNASGAVVFDTIYPGWYSGRTPHIHVRVRIINPATQTVGYNFVSQMFFNDSLTNSIFANVYPYNLRPNRDTFNADDHVYTGGSAGGELASGSGSRLMLNLSQGQGRLVGTFNVVIDVTDPNYNNPNG